MFPTDPSIEFGKAVGVFLEQNDRWARFQIGPWNGIWFSGGSGVNQNIINADMVINGTEVVYSCLLHNSYVVSRLVLSSSGQLERWVWVADGPKKINDEYDRTTANLAAPYWERPTGPIWWCHVTASHPHINSWFTNASWLHPEISIALRDEIRLISERMKHLLYEVLVRVAGGLLFELLGQYFGNPYIKEDDVPDMLRSWQAQNSLVTALHQKGVTSLLNGSSRQY
ncbi:unnamed protein product [Lactuca virosa]|uniref:S-locus glycoprotein domain-containing protein n=1 Tax=Lactuca virosa TaxID=75947 RepID=A0AAU9NBE0_9ASTR|nr:unnamed protein product [Lactuca virosa]